VGDVLVTGPGNQRKEIALHGTRLNDEPIRGAKGVTGEHAVAGTGFMRDHVVADIHDLRLCPPPDDARNGPEAWAEERERIVKHQEIGPAVPDDAPHCSPVEGIDRIDDGDARHGILVAGRFLHLRLSGEEKPGYCRENVTMSTAWRALSALYS